ncbi:ABC transporter permease subunit [Endozoicomonadaceae bacterium StTr2]
MNQEALSASPRVDMDTPALRRHRSIRKSKDWLARWSVAFGGIGVIVAILLIFLYLLYEVVPLMRSAEVERVTTYPVAAANTSSGKILYTTMEEQAEIGLNIDSTGGLRFFDTRSGDTLLAESLPLPAGTTITSFTSAGAAGELVAAGLSNGEVLVLKHIYRTSWPNDKRVITPAVEWPFGSDPIALAPAAVDGLVLQDSEEQLLIAGLSQGELVMTRLLKEVDFLTEEVTLEPEQVNVPRLEGVLGKMLLSPDLSWLYVQTGADQLTVLEVPLSGSPQIAQVVTATENKAEITSMSFLLGGISVLVGDSSGEISQWFHARNEQGDQMLQRARSFSLGSAPITVIEPEHRRKGFLAADNTGVVGIFSTTSSRTLLKENIGSQVTALGISPRANALLVNTASGQSFWKVDNEHPEVSWSALWDKVWYESYDEPEYIWQSSASNNDFEPKFSLMPLAFGTLKAAFYAMLLATPLAICGAIYTAYFMAPAMRRKVKPVIELMEALPTVILGFLAGLWLAPYIEANLAGIFGLLICIPVSMLLFAFSWDRLPENIRHRVPDGWQPMLLVPVVLLAGWFSIEAGLWMEHAFFGGDMRTWVTTDLGIPYDQRNALVVGLAMGFAVIPTIFSITEDAVFSVPKHLSYGSLALGATPWQTLTKVVLLTASPGIFSAVMIGMGRAVGETMIVLMATGNTPIMDANIFEGMRTLAANIAVEMPESEVGSTHYRILFLAALVLFMFTFVVNTIAEMVRHRLRRKYSTL